MNGMEGAAEVPPIPWRVLRRWLLVALALAVLLYVVGFDQGAVSRAGNLLHEAMHDGRHALGLPCH